MDAPKNGFCISDTADRLSLAEYDQDRYIKISLLKKKDWNFSLVMTGTVTHSGAEADMSTSSAPVAPLIMIVIFRNIFIMQQRHNVRNGCYRPRTFDWAEIMVSHSIRLNDRCSIGAKAPVIKRTKK